MWIFKVILQNVIALRGDFNGSLNLEMKNRIQLDSRGLIEKVRIKKEASDSLHMTQIYPLPHINRLMN